MSRRLLFGLSMVLAVTGAASAGMIDEKPLPRSLYDRLGGQPAIVLVVDAFVGNVLGDPRISGRFANTDVPRLKALLVDQICEAAGGPCRSAGRDTPSAHSGSGVTAEDGDVLAEDLARALDTLRVPAQDQGELLGILGQLPSLGVGQ
jgi:hemoglobin